MLGQLRGWLFTFLAPTSYWSYQLFQKKKSCVITENRTNLWAKTKESYSSFTEKREVQRVSRHLSRFILFLCSSIRCFLTFLFLLLFKSLLMLVYLLPCWFRCSTCCPTCSCSSCFTWASAYRLTLSCNCFLTRNKAADSCSVSHCLPPAVATAGSGYHIHLQLFLDQIVGSLLPGLIVRYLLQQRRHLRQRQPCIRLLSCDPTLAPGTYCLNFH